MEFFITLIEQAKTFVLKAFLVNSWSVAIAGFLRVTLVRVIITPTRLVSLIVNKCMCLTLIGISGIASTVPQTFEMH